MKKDKTQSDRDRAALEDVVVPAITKALRATTEREALRQATQQTDDALEEVMASASVQRRFSNALSAYFVEHIPCALDRLRKETLEDAGSPTKLFLDLGAAGERVPREDQPREEAPDTTVDDLEKEMVKNLRELMLSDAKEDED